MNYTREFKNICKTDFPIAGGKGASLGEMTQAGIPIPPGFVVLSNAFDAFLKDTDIHVKITAILKTVKVAQIHTLDHASEKIQSLVLNATVPHGIEQEVLKNFRVLGAKYVAVRSSATAEDSKTAAWAGQLESHLNTTAATLLENIKKCWASLFTPRAIFYRFEQGLHSQMISVAVVIQQMVQSEVSGIAFSVHPVTHDKNKMIIEAGLGLGEAIVSGSITPDTYIVEKSSLAIVDKKVNYQITALVQKGMEMVWKKLSRKEGSIQKLSIIAIKKLAKLIMQIEKHYGFPVDVEWAQVKGRYYIVQSRPITTLAQLKQAGAKDVTSKWENVVSRKIDLQKSIQFANGAYRNFAKVFGIPGITKQIFHFDGKTTRTYFFASEHNAAKNNFRKLVSNVDFVTSYEHKIWKLYRDVESKAQKLAGGYDKLTTVELAKTFSAFDRAWSQFYGIAWSAFYINALDGVVNEALIHTLKLSKSKAASIHKVIAQPYIISPVSRKETAILEATANGGNVAKSAELITREYGWMSVYNFGDEPTHLQTIIKEIGSHKKDAKELLKQAHVRRKQNEKKYQKFILTIRDKTLRAQIELMHVIGFIRDSREQIRNNMTALETSLYREIAKRKGLNLFNIVQLTNSEIGQLIRNVLPAKKARQLARERNQQFLLVYTKGKIETLTSSPQRMQKYLESQSILVTAHQIITGEVASTGGTVTGRVKVVFAPKDVGKVKIGDVLVATMTKPTFLPAMKKAIAFITDEGGITVHAAIIAREMKKPCIIGTRIATQLLKDGDMVEVNTQKGTITKL